MPDSLVSPSGTYVLRVKAAQAGLKHVELVPRGGPPLFVMNDDLVNALWAPDERGVLYAVSPMYGAPGVYIIDARLGTRNRVIAPRNMTDSAYPEGADWIALCAVAVMADGRLVVSFVRFPHVDSLDLRRDLPSLKQEADTI